MKKNIILICSIATVFISAAVTILYANWNIDPNYSIKFSGKKAEGSFSGLKGTIIYDNNDLEHSKIDVEVDAASIKTGNPTKDGHAKSESWLDVEKYPKIKFTTISFSKSGEKYITKGTLELHGTKKEIEIPYTFTEKDGKGAFEGSFKVNRKDFGIKGNMMSFAVGDEFEVTIKVPVNKR